MQDLELKAMVAITKQLEKLTEQQQTRVIKYFNDRIITQPTDDEEIL